MKIKLGDLVKSKEVLLKLTEKDLPIETSFKLSLIAEKVTPELNAFEQQRIKLVKKHGVKDDKGNYTVLDENIDSFGKDIILLYEQDVEFEKVTGINIEDLGNEIKMSAKDLILLNWLFEK